MIHSDMIITKLCKYRKNKLKKKTAEAICLNNPLFLQTSFCRICYKPTVLYKKLYAYCECKNDLRWYHRECLEEWMKHKTKNKKKCDICKTPYKYIK